MQLTAGLFAGICGQSEPRDVYLAATLGGCSGGDGGGSFRRTLEDMGIPVLVCSSHRLHSAVARSLGGCGGAVDSNGAGNICGGSSNGEKCANGKMRDVVRRAVSMVEIFQHWGPPEGGSSAGPTAALETVRAEVEELAVALTRTRRANARRVQYVWARRETVSCLWVVVVETSSKVEQVRAVATFDPVLVLMS